MARADCLRELSNERDIAGRTGVAHTDRRSPGQREYGRSVWEVVLPVGLPLLNINRRLHYHQRARITRVLRDEGLIASLAARVPELGEACVIGYAHPAKEQCWDTANLYPSFKAIIDGALVDAGVVVDDDHLHVSGPHMFPAESVSGGQFRLVVIEMRRCGCGHGWMEHAGQEERCVHPRCSCVRYAEAEPMSVVSERTG